MTSAMPKENAEGHLVWNPSVGLYHKPAANNAESYGGIVGALQDLIAKAGEPPKAYPYNFAGIIAAIQDLDVAASEAPVTPDVKPPGGNIIIDINGQPIWDEITPPDDGTLWFDTRQGRLFVAIDGDWIQTNGADGLAYVTPDANAPASSPVDGQFWWDSAHNTLYIFDGQWIQADGTISNINDGNSTPLWRVVNKDPDESLQTTLTLPLGNLGPRLALYDAINDGGILPPIDPTDYNVQADYNIYLWEALLALEQHNLTQSAVTVSETAPDEPKQGDLWYDTTALDMSIWYVEPGDDVTEGQWVPSAVAYNYDADLDVIRSMMLEEKTVREQQFDTLRAQLVEFDGVDNEQIIALQQAVAALGERITNEIPDVTPYTTTVSLDAVEASLRIAIEEAKALPQIDLTPYVTNSILSSAIQTLTESIATKTEQSDLQAISDSIPSVDHLASEDYVTQAIANITTEYLPRGGGTLTGSFTMVKEDYALPVFDFSTAPHYGKDAFKFQSAIDTTTTFGTTENPWEIAWQFGSDEDYSWIYNNNKVFSISKEGPACSTLYLADFATNTNNGRRLLNKIDLKERLTKYQNAFQNIRQGVANATDFDSLKANILTALIDV
jgi:hypothetical protein